MVWMLCRGRAPLPPAFSAKKSETDAMNLILTGLRGTGKSSIGRRLALALGRPFFDTDQLIEQQIREPISQYVNRLGWDAFRDLEHQVIRQVACQRAAVISSGGGTLTFARNVEMLKPNSIIILLAADPATLAKRLKRSYARPPLTDQPNLEAEMGALWTQREPLYRKVSDVVLGVDAESTDDETDLQGKVSTLLTLLRPYLCDR
jgi:shikimate kinase